MDEHGSILVTGAAGQLGAVGRIQELEFHHGGTAKPSKFVADWTNYKKAGPLLFSLLLLGKADGHPFSITLSNVAVKLAGSNEWIEAK